jgi:hypothetical protein
MGLVFEKVCKDYLLRKNSEGALPVLFTAVGRWWGTDPAAHQQIEIDLIAQDGDSYLMCECKWRNEALGISVLDTLRHRADVFCKNRDQTWYVLFSKSGFTKAVMEEAERDENIILVDMQELMK